MLPILIWIAIGFLIYGSFLEFKEFLEQRDD